MSEVPEGFHAHSDWWFRREADGSVHVFAPGGLDVTFDASVWASIVASVSSAGGTSETYSAAVALHDGQ